MNNTNENKNSEFTKTFITLKCIKDSFESVG